MFLGNDWAEAHHDIELVDESGRRLVRRRLPKGVEVLAALHALIAEHLDEDAESTRSSSALRPIVGRGCRH